MFVFIDIYLYRLFFLLDCFSTGVYSYYLLHFSTLNLYCIVYIVVYSVTVSVCTVKCISVCGNAVSAITNLSC